VNKNVAGKEWQLKTYFAVLPLAHRFVLWEKAINATFRKLVRNPPFVVRSRVCGIPPRTEDVFQFLASK
jgi:hypothetical protein